MIKKEEIFKTYLSKVYKIKLTDQLQLHKPNELSPKTLPINI